MSSQWYGQHGSAPPNAGQIPVVNSILKDFSAEALGELRTWLEQNPPAVSVTSILGFSQFTANVAPTVATQETTASLTYVDLATVGPTVDELPDGRYLFIYGAAAKNSVAGNATRIALSINAATPLDIDAAYTESGVISGSVMAAIKTLANGGNNTVTCQYRVDAGTGTWRNRWLVALRFANS